MKKEKIIALCSSGSFYEHVNHIADELKLAGFKVKVPETAEHMHLMGEYDIEAHRTWYKNPKDYHIKTAKMRGHFDKIVASDAILVVNDDKKDQSSYIGPNTIMEMAVAFFLQKPIFILNKVPKSLPVYEEVHGMNSIILNGDLAKIKL